MTSGAPVVSGTCVPKLSWRPLQNQFIKHLLVSTIQIQNILNMYKIIEQKAEMTKKKKKTYKKGIKTKRN